jgi:hypothetical protein
MCCLGGRMWGPYRRLLGSRWWGGWLAPLLGGCWCIGDEGVLFGGVVVVVQRVCAFVFEAVDVNWWRPCTS